MKTNNVKYIALYLPQFHTFKENDEWWGKGFTEWTNTRAAIPLFDGHYQPHEPHEDVGYYDLSTSETMIKQAEMAKEYGIYGFCYYFYWFNGRKLMEKPLENMLNDKKVDIPFCFMWANHNWTRSWDAGNKEILLEQTYDKNTNKKFIDDLIPYFEDERYIRIDGRPVLLIYQMDLIPNPKKTVNEWRKYAKSKYNIDLYIISTQQNNMDDPRDFNCDAAMECTPNFRSGKSLLNSNTPELASDTQITFYDYLTNIFIYLLRKENKYKLFRSVYPMFDNTARRKKKNGWMFLGACPDLFRKFLIDTTRLTIKSLKPKEQFVFINAWNEWAEGAHLEPDKKYGYQLLEICKEVGSMKIEELKKNGFSKKTYKEMSKKLYPFKFIEKERIGKIRNIKIFNKTIFTYKKD